MEPVPLFIGDGTDAALFSALWTSFPDELQQPPQEVLDSHFSVHLSLFPLLLSSPVPPAQNHNPLWFRRRCILFSVSRHGSHGGRGGNYWPRLFPRRPAAERRAAATPIANQLATKRAPSLPLAQRIRAPRRRRLPGCRQPPNYPGRRPAPPLHRAPAGDLSPPAPRGIYYRGQGGLGSQRIGEGSIQTP